MLFPFPPFSSLTLPSSFLPCLPIPFPLCPIIFSSFFLLALSTFFTSFLPSFSLFPLLSTPLLQAFPLTTPFSAYFPLCFPPLLPYPASFSSFPNYFSSRLSPPFPIFFPFLLFHLPFSSLHLPLFLLTSLILTCSSFFTLYFPPTAGSPFPLFPYYSYLFSSHISLPFNDFFIRLFLFPFLPFLRLSFLTFFLFLSTSSFLLVPYFPSFFSSPLSLLFYCFLILLLSFPLLSFPLLSLLTVFLFLHSFSKFSSLFSSSIALPFCVFLLPLLPGLIFLHLPSLFP